MRRQTLGPISSNTLNARVSMLAAQKDPKAFGKRQSIAPASRPSVGGERTSMGGRSSLGRRKSVAGAPPRQSLTRRSSVYGNKPKVQDPRPMSDKTYQTRNQKALISFLTTHHFDSVITFKSVSSPTRKDFQHICEFIFRACDPNFQGFPEGKFEEEFIAYFKFLHYPSNISKQSLFAVGSPHTWPAVCAALVWYIEEISVWEAGNGSEIKAESDMDAIGMDREKMFFEYLGQAYLKFLEGDDNHTALEADLEQTFAARNQSVNEEIQRFQAENERLKKEIAALKNSASTVSGLQSKRADYLADIGKFQNLNKKLLEHKLALEAKVAERTQEVKEKEHSLTETESERKALEKALSEQQFSPLEVQRMNQEKVMLEESLRSLASQKEEAQKKVWELEIALAKKLDEVERHALEYNEKASLLQLIPATARFASGIDFELRVNPQAATSEEMLSLDLKGLVKPALLKLREEFAEKIRTAQTELLEATEKAEQLQYVRKEKEEEVKEVQSRLKKIEATFQQERETMNRQLKEKVAQVEDIELDIHRMRSTSSAQVEKAEKELAQLDTEKEHVESMCAEQLQLLSEEVCQAMDSVSRHKMMVSKTLSDALARVQQVRDSIVS